MDPHQQHPHPLDHDQNQSGLGPTPYGFYAPEHDPSFGISYNPQMNPYHVVPTGGPQPHLHGIQSYHPQHLGLISPHQYQPPPPQQQQQQPVFATTPSPHGTSHSLSASPPPPSPDMYDPLSPPMSGSDTSADGLYHHHSSGGSRSSSRASNNTHSLVHRSNRFNPTPSPTSSSGRRRSRSRDSDEDDLGPSSHHHHHHTNLASSRKEATRRQRIEAEQRRRDELRDGYAKLKDVLPVSNQKSSKVSLLERATTYIVVVEKQNQELQARIEALEEEVARLQALNEKISLAGSSTEGQTPSPGRFLNDGRPLSPPPDGPLMAVRRSQEPMPLSPSTPSASENGF